MFIESYTTLNYLHKEQHFTAYKKSSLLHLDRFFFFGYRYFLAPLNAPMYIYIYNYTYILYIVASTIFVCPPIYMVCPPIHISLATPLNRYETFFSIPIPINTQKICFLLKYILQFVYMNKSKAALFP